MADSDSQRNRQNESPKSKKPRLEKSLEGDAIFKEFYSDVKLLEDLEIYIKAIQKWNDYSLCMLNISNCNATGSYTFLKTFCQTERYKHEHRIIHNSEIVKKFSFASIFKHGEELLASYVKPRNESCLTQRKSARLAFAKLLHFLSNELEDAERSLMTKKCGAQESDCAVILAHHLLSKLAVSTLLVVKMDSGYKKQHLTCPCQCGEHPSGIYSDTSIGSPEVWHGNVDAMMDISIKFVKEEACTSDGYGNEAKIADLKTDREQIIAQSIVSSFYQKRINPDYTDHMIPSIGISKDKIVVYFYDCIWKALKCPS